MATTAGILDLAPASRGEEQARLGRRDECITLLLGTWLMLGVFVDGWAHNTRGEALETFFTPWHAHLYSGFAACATWLGWLILRRRRAGAVGRAAIPRGYELGLAGVLVFGAAGVGDLLWHR